MPSVLEAIRILRARPAGSLIPGLILTFLLVLGTLSTGQAVCVDYADTPHLVHRVPTYNPGYDIVLDGDRAYWIGTWTGAEPLRVFDISDPTLPVQIDQTWLDGDPGHGVIADGHLYVAGYSYPLRLGTVEVLELPGLGVAAFGGVADHERVRSLSVEGDLVSFITDESFEVARVEGDSVVVVGSVPLSGDAWSMAMDGAFAYIANRNEGLRVVDASDPFAPEIVTTLPTPGVCWGVAVRGDTIYLADGNAGLITVDVSDPTSPILLGQYEGVGDARTIQIEGTTAFLGSEDDLVLIDVSDPADPIRIKAFGMRSCLDFAVQGEYVFNPRMGFSVYRHSDPREIETLGSLETPLIEDLEVDGDLALLASAHEIQLIDLEDPASPELVGTYPRTEISFREIERNGVYAYTLVEEDRLVRVLNISDPTKPALVGSLAVHSLPVVDLEVGDGIAYGWTSAGAHESELLLMSLDYSHFPIVISNLEIPYGIDGIAYQDELAYLFEEISDGGVSRVHLVIADLDPEDPRLVSDTELEISYAEAVVVDGNRLYLSGDSYPEQLSYLATFDITDPSAPELLEIAHAPPGVQMAVDGHLYLASKGNGVYAYDLSDPDHPEQIGAWNTPGEAERIAAHGEFLVCSTGRRLAIGPRACLLASVGPGEPASLSIGKAIPNPHRGTAEIHFALPFDRTTRLAVYDVTGRRIRHWTSEDLPIGSRDLVWDGTDGAGRTLPSGFYRIVLATGEERESLPIVRLR